MFTKRFILSVMACATAVTSQTQAQQLDPTRPPSVIAQQLAPLQVNTGFTLSAIFTRNAQRYAVVNGEVLKQGDEYMGMKVARINAANITLTDLVQSNKDITLQVQNDSGMSKQVVK